MKMNSLRYRAYYILLIAGILTVTSCKRVATNSTDIESRVNKLLAEMTLDEKIGQMSQFDPGTAGTQEQLKN
jgi:beta-glucosidase